MTNKNESPINAAIREFYEETNIKKNKYKLLYDINPITHIFSDDNITYKYVYYIALLLDNKYTLQLDLKPDSHIMEISEMQFFNTFNYYILTKNKTKITVMKNIIKIAKNYF
jgi:8-oxo-dGTP pyrophosphatase MutT (NUDIX family)